MRLAFRLDIAPSGLPPSPASTATECPVFSSSVARLCSAAPCIDLGERGCIVGPLFRREIPSGRVTDLNRDERQSIAETRGLALLAGYWGGYIAMLIGDDGTVSLMRDPSGMMPCYMRRAASGVVLASDMTAIAEPGQVAVDYSALARMFGGIDFIGRKTGIDGVEELLPGERLVVTADGNRIEQAWSPWDHVRPPIHIICDRIVEHDAMLRSIAQGDVSIASGRGDGARNGGGPDSRDAPLRIRSHDFH